MRRLALLAVLLAAAPAWAQTALDSASLYISDPLKWERGYRPGQPAPKLALAGILVLEPDEDLAMIACYLYKEPDNSLHVVYPEGISISSGTWKKTDRQLAVRFRSIHASARRLDGSDEQYKEESWTYGPSRKGDRLAEWIKIGGVRYVPLRDLSGLKELAEVIQFYRKEAEASK